MSKANPEEIAELLRAGGVAVDHSTGVSAISHPASPLPPGGPSLAPQPKDPIKTRIEAAAKIGAIGYASGNPITFDFATPGEMFIYFNEELQPTQWQLEELHRIGGYLNLEDPAVADPIRPDKDHPYLFNLVAANGSGKDTYFISPNALWFVSAKIRSRVIVTSASQDQLKLQTFNYLKNYAERVNNKLGYDVYDIKEFYIYNNLTGSEIVGRVTNDAGRVEGFHPFETPLNCEMMVIVNEAKSIDDDTYAAFARFTGYNYWLNVSSPGFKSGVFYKTCVDADSENFALGRQYKRHITAYECPHISRNHIATVEKLHGRDSHIFITSILAQFYSSEVDVVIPESLFDYATPPHDTYGLPPSAGLDLGFSLEGDPTRWSLWHGNKELENDLIRTNNADKLHFWIIEKINSAQRRFNLQHHHVYVDGGGLGAPVISRVREAGYEIVTRRNEYSAVDKSYYLNLGAEMYFRVKRLIQQRVLIVPPDHLAKQQLSERKALLAVGTQKYKLEAKQDAKKRLGYSPDRADSIVLALSGYPLDVLLSRPPAAQDALKKTARNDIRDKIGSFPFDYPDADTIQQRKKIYGLNHEFITQYAKR